MKTTIDAEFYTNWIAKFRDSPPKSIKGYFIEDSITRFSEAELKEAIVIYLKNNPDMLLDNIIEQKRIKFRYLDRLSPFNLVIEEDSHYY